jgi:hypothetical protein
MTMPFPKRLSPDLSEELALLAHLNVVLQGGGTKTGVQTKNLRTGMPGGFFDLYKSGD